MNVFIALVSHNHSELINDINVLSGLLDTFKIVVKSNTSNDDFSKFNEHDNFHWLNSNYGKGFGSNNNYIFNYCINELDAVADDIFIVLNPDVIVDKNSILSLIKHMIQDGVSLSAINLFKDSNYQIFDNSIRKYPRLIDLTLSLVTGKNKTLLDKSNIISPIDIEWAAGSFLCFKIGHYKALSGFDESYFMYCEDIDICFRSNEMGCKVRYYPFIKAIHLAQHANRRIFSKHFFWHLSSAIRFIAKKNGLINGVVSSLIGVDHG